MAVEENLNKSMYKLLILMLKYIPMLISLVYVLNVDSLKRFTDKERRLSKYAACEYLNVSRATFDNYVREGKLPRGKHEIGFKELSWSKKELDEFVKKCRINQRLRSNPKSEIA